jgi:hypothetical protein
MEILSESRRILLPVVLVEDPGHKERMYGLSGTTYDLLGELMG